MRTRIVRIGNSQGIRIPKALLEQTDLHGEVEISVRGGSLVISAVAPVRNGWEDAFARWRRAVTTACSTVTPSTADSFDAKDWEWQ